MEKKLSGAPVICFGEALWDLLPQGERIGGAPLNVAYHLCKLGVDAALVTRIGKDKYGEGVKKFMEKNGLHHAVLQIDHDHSTGKVEVMLQPDQEISYDITGDAAWDFIEYDHEINKLVDKAGYLVYGSLITRSRTSRETLFQLLEKPLIKVLDVNLRAPFYSKAVLEKLISKADVIKMNEGELCPIADWFGGRGNHEEKMKGLHKMFNLEAVIVTHGSKGASVLQKDKIFFEPGREIKVVDTVGSGDAFLAGFISAYIAGMPLPAALRSANAMGAFIAQRSGGCPDYHKKDIGPS